jgi:plastocyanin
MRRLKIGTVLLASLALASAALAADTVNVSQQNRKFAPEVLQIARGTTVHIVNDDKVTHHIYIDSPTMKFDSGEQPVGKSVDVVFDRDGSFTVRCAIHPTMHLAVTVQ